MGWIDWIGKHLLPCPTKYFFGMDCPGCGMQRSLFELMKGNFAESLKMYPALIPVLITLLLLILHLRLKLKNGPRMVQYAFIFSSFVIITSFIVKQVNHFHQ